MPALQTMNVRPGQWKIVYCLLIQYQRCYGYFDNFETKLSGEQPLLLVTVRVISLLHFFFIGHSFWINHKIIFSVWIQNPPYYQLIFPLVWKTKNIKTYMTDICRVQYNR